MALTRSDIPALEARGYRIHSCTLNQLMGNNSAIRADEIYLCGERKVYIRDNRSLAYVRHETVLALRKN